MDRTVKALSLLLSYPTEELQTAMPEISGVIASETRLTAAARRDLRPLIDELTGRDIYDLQEQFVMLFDRSRTLSLNLFEHVHGESRDRGGAMVNLLETYRAGGFEPSTSELPDHLPVLLEFLASRSPTEIHDTLSETAHILEAIRSRLVRRGSNYQAVFSAILQLSSGDVDNDAVAQLLEQPEVDPNDLKALDEVWEESEVTFGPDPGAGCPQVRDMLSKIDQSKRSTAAE
ncbi:nitrate reductase molybdenum cofactor assembly chaperone [Thalassospira xiamenensis]|uniref:Nitrate reductase n=1 Tax=Thalassospira xiamenensis TaxID=220697 RepID=A0A367X8J5_9PROT|nr:nitrate reductase molybdenum cofactor assembly chaperone [Thalassospira xiamenensis]KZB56346.1 nitrate reductase [Thalassospira xiamenensis]MCK2167212.1 nitrate reductase molybdenum cofactor assembly chaperone [Thalassospira xiamenensis]RCK49986.1 nitrate reductase [Thalassospira xiamenensis]